MLHKWFDLIVVGVAVLAAVILVSSGTKVPRSDQTASVIDVITDIAPTESAPVVIEPTPAELTSITPADIPNFTETLQIVTDPVEKIFNLVPIEPVPILTPKGASSLKVFVLAQDTLESVVNEWFSVQENIVVDQFNVQDYGGGGYLIVISYHTGGAGNLSTRLKIIAGENPETEAQAFLSSLNSSQAVRSITAVAGSYSGLKETVTVPIIFIVYE